MAARIIELWPFSNVNKWRLLSEFYFRSPSAVNTLVTAILKEIITGLLFRSWKLEKRNFPETLPNCLFKILMVIQPWFNASRIKRSSKYGFDILLRTLNVLLDSNSSFVKAPPILSDLISCLKNLINSIDSFWLTNVFEYLWRLICKIIS